MTIDDDEPAIALARRAFPGARVQKAAPLTGGVSARVTEIVLVLDDGSERALVARTLRENAFKEDARSDVALEHAILDAARAAGVPVPRAIASDRATLLMERVVGTSALPDDPAPAMADALTRLHAIDPAPFVSTLPAREDPLAPLLEWCAADVDVVRALARARDDDALAGSPACLLHGDFWPGNLLWKDGALAAVLDFEDAAIGDPLSDLACARAELSVALVDDDARRARVVAAFTARVFARGENDTRGARGLAIWDLYVATGALRAMDQWGLAPEVLERRRRATTRFVEEARARLLDESVR